MFLAIAAVAVFVVLLVLFYRNATAPVPDNYPIDRTMFKNKPAETVTPVIPAETTTTNADTPAKGKKASQ